METKSIKLPGFDHPITIEPNPARVTVSVAGRIIADSERALTLREASYAAVQSIPQEDVDMTQLKRTLCRERRSSLALQLTRAAAEAFGRSERRLSDIIP
jgi:uncharacterized protein (DUF427 family)